MQRILNLWNHPVQVLISNENTLFIPKPSFYLGLGFSLVFLAIEDTDFLETGELDFHMAHKPHCWEGVLENFACAQRSGFGLCCAVLNNFITLPAPVTVLSAAGKRSPGGASSVLREAKG